MEFKFKVYNKNIFEINKVIELKERLLQQIWFKFR